MGWERAVPRRLWGTFLPLAGACRDEFVRLPGPAKKKTERWPGPAGKYVSATYCTFPTICQICLSQQIPSVTCTSPWHEAGASPSVIVLCFRIFCDVPKAEPRWPGPARKKRCSGRGVPWQALGFSMAGRGPQGRVRAQLAWHQRTFQFVCFRGGPQGTKGGPQGTRGDPFRYPRLLARGASCRCGGCLHIPHTY